VVESKIGSNFGPDQLQNYRQRLDAPDAFPGVPTRSRFLVTLTTTRHVSSLSDGAITWPQVWGILVGAPASQGPHDPPLVPGLVVQFAAFLKEKGLSMLELKKTDTKTLAQWSAIKNLEQQLTLIVERLRNQQEVKPFVGRKQVKTDELVWVGVYGRQAFWAGFGILPTDTGPQLAMWVEITVPGDRRTWIEQLDSKTKSAFKQGRRYLQFLKDNSALNYGNLTEGNSRFVFAQPVDDNLNGNAEAAFACLYELSKYAISLTQRAGMR
jgi:hypothetical protein